MDKILNKDFDDIDFENVIDSFEQQKIKKKRVNSDSKGKRGERNLGKVLKKRFGFEFVRTIGSGNRHGQVLYLPKHASDTFSGDLVCPANFRFCIECKNGYDNIKLESILLHHHPKIDEWIEQSSGDSDRTGRMPWLIWKRKYTPWIAFMPTSQLAGRQFERELRYYHWTFIGLEDIFQLEDKFFFA